MTTMLGFRLLCRGYARLHVNKEALPVKEPRLLKVAIIGMPNAGKSTLINRLLELDVCPVSKRVHTTREAQKAIYLRDNTQVIFVDTPGVVNQKEIKKFNFSTDFSSAPQTAIQDADVVGVIHDVSNRILRHKLDPRVVRALDEFPGKDVILILNKVDTIKFKRSLLDAVRFLTKATVGGRPIAVKYPQSRKELSKEELLARASLRQSNGGKVPVEALNKSENPEENNTGRDEFEVNGWGGFNDVFMISALSGDGVNLLQDYFVANASPASWEFSDDVLTDCPPMELALKILKSKLLEYLPQEVPYTVEPSIDFWEDDDESGKLRIICGITCPKERFAKIVIGQGGSNINQITSAMEKDLSRLLQKTIDLHIKVIAPEKVKKEVN